MVAGALAAGPLLTLAKVLHGKSILSARESFILLVTTFASSLDLPLPCLFSLSSLSSLVYMHRTVTVLYLIIASSLPSQARKRAIKIQAGSVAGLEADQPRTTTHNHNPQPTGYYTAFGHGLPIPRIRAYRTLHPWKAHAPRDSSTLECSVYNIISLLFSLSSFFSAAIVNSGIGSPVSHLEYAFSKT